MTTTAEREDDWTLTAEYALGLLTPAESAAFEDRLAVDPAFRADLADWHESFARLTDGIDPVTPPPGLEDRLTERLFGVPERRGLLRRLGLVPALAGGLVAALLVLFVTNQGLLTGPDVPEGPIYATEMATPAGDLVVRAAYDPATGTLALDRDAGAAPPGRSLEVWLIADGADPASLGILSDDPRTDLTVAADHRAAMPGGLLALTDEPAGGSPSGAPSGAPIA